MEPLKITKFNDLRISLGVAAPTPIRCLKAEEFSKGIEINMNNIIEISEKALLDANQEIRGEVQRILENI